jgi:hypothetical protein
MRTSFHNEEKEIVFIKQQQQQEDNINTVDVTAGRNTNGGNHIKNNNFKIDVDAIP